ncbi:hypothetical protein Vspart_01376 [Vibrio spartinae]|uniref:Uncharacterized protein n=1 Tax=Vibrio spartinae TaxID=1918945 RepID=A0A1N6M7G5_9VIBR|nr:hypothetical protein Vspart_01376 [Vibrio spartinae]SIO95391.1 hypothetical protein VSP9026_03134 [Vibrio spartinae]
MKSVIPSGGSFQAFLERLCTGHLVLLTDVPSIPLLTQDRDELENQYWRGCTSA